MTDLPPDAIRRAVQAFAELEGGALVAGPWRDGEGWLALLVEGDRMVFRVFAVERKGGA